jgi:signal transduction histidine kinase
MAYLALVYHLDVVLFALLALLAMACAHRWVQKATRLAGFPWHAWVMLAGVLFLGCFVALAAGRREATRLRHMVAGFAPTYAEEMAQQGFGKISVDTPPTDPAYLQLIAMEKRWLSANPSIADIYTFGRNHEGKTVLLVDSETDYNHDGVIDGEREQRTPLGEIYDEDSDVLPLAFAGQSVFTPRPISDRWGTWVSTYVPIRGDSGAVLGVLGVDFPANDWISSILWARLTVLVFAVLVATVLVGSLAATAALKAEIVRRRQMEVEREQLHQKLLESSRQAGMAEIATGVLHNVGNVLNSVNVSATVLSEKLKAADASGIAQAADLLRQRLDSPLAGDELGRQLPDFLSALAGCMEDDQKSLVQEVAGLARGIDHIKAIVQSQQSFAKTSVLLAPATPADLLDQAAAMNLLSLERHGIELVKDYGETPLPAFHLDKHRVLQVLVNLISNARNAIKDLGGEPAGARRIILRAAAIEREGNSFVRFEVQDTGVGIPQENLTRIFRHGFTTRATGHGFGLHSAANAATEMQGALTVHSDGPGRGAAFTLELPATKSEVLL